MPDAAPQHRPAPAVTLSGVSRLFGSYAALREVSLTFEHGDTVMLLGENGAGKSTLLRVISGLLAPSFGTAAVFGEDPRDVRERIALMSHATMLYDELTAVENLSYFARLYAAERETLGPEASLEAVGLDPNNPRRVGEYSQGMRQRAALARALMTHPDLLLLDEPFSNLDTSSVERMIARLAAFQAEPGTDGRARTLIFTTHQRELAAPLRPQAVTLREGRVMALSDSAPAAVTPREFTREVRP